MRLTHLGAIVFAAGLLVESTITLAQNPPQDQGQPSGRQGRRSGRFNRGPNPDAQANQPGPTNPAGPSGRSFGSRQRGGGPSSRGGRGGGPSNMTPADRERFYGQMVDRYAERLSGTYELNDTQKTQVRSKLDEIKGQQIAYSQQNTQEYQSLHEESHKLRDAARDGGQIDAQRQQEVEKRLQALRQDSPLMNSERVTQEVEKLLPPDQVQRGRARQQAEHQQSQQQRDQMRQQWDQRRQQRVQNQADQPPAASPPGAPAPAADQPPASDAGAAAQPSPNDHRGHRGGRGAPGDRMSHRGPRSAGGEQVGAFHQGTPGNAGEAIPRDGRRGRVIREDPISPWEQYIRDFIRQYNLDEAQQATAWSILREMQERRTAHEQTHRVDYENARKLEDAGQRERRLSDLNSTVVRLFDELKSRLMRIPSTAQRQKAGLSDSTSQPAAEPASRPS